MIWIIGFLILYLLSSIAAYYIADPDDRRDMDIYSRIVVYTPASIFFVVLTILILVLIVVAEIFIKIYLDLIEKPIKIIKWRIERKKLLEKGIIKINSEDPYGEENWSD